MDESLFNEQDNYDLNGYGEDILEDDYYDEDYIDEDEAFFDESAEEDYYNEDDFTEDLDEARRRGRRGKRKLRSRRSRTPGGRRSPLARPKYFRPSPSNRPATTKNVVKAFDTASKDIQKTNAAVANVDYKNSVHGKVLKSHSERIKGNEYALAAKTIVAELSKEFPILTENPVMNALTQSVPGFFQKSEYRQFLKDPRKMTPIIIGAIGLFRELRDKNKGSVQNVTAFPPVRTINVREQYTINAMARDINGKPIKDINTFQWIQDNNNVRVENGLVTGERAGSSKIYIVEPISGRSVVAEVNVVA